MEPALAHEVLLDPLEVARERGPRVAPERIRDLAEREAQVAEGADLVEPPNVVLAIEPVARLRALRRPEQPDLVVVMERPHGEPGGRGKLADLPELLFAWAVVRPHVT